jgi:hypothetical protein
MSGDTFMRIFVIVGLVGLLSILALALSLDYTIKSEALNKLTDLDSAKILINTLVN